MSIALWICLIVAAVSAPANWWSRWVQHRSTELWSKPATLIALIGIAVLLDPIDTTVRAWFVIALVFSLAGDVFLLGGSRWFLPGLVAFLFGHLAYTLGFLAIGVWRWWAAAASTVVLLAVGATVGRRIVRGARARSPQLGLPVAGYLVVISAMVVAAAAAGNGWAVAGAVLFLVSDAVLGWREFVGSHRALPLIVMVTYHLAQAGLVISLV